MQDKKNGHPDKHLAVTCDDESSAHSILASILRMGAQVSPEPRSVELASLDCAAGRILAEDVAAGCDAPLFNESMRDGYAIGSGGLDPLQSCDTFTLVGETGAGDSLALHLGEGETWKVMTGGKVPGNCTRVVPQELCVVSGSVVTIDSNYLAGQTFVRRKGSQHKVGDILVHHGELITPGLLLKIADAGRANVEIYGQPKVCFCCTGKELVGAGVVPGDAQKISSNQYLLSALLRQYGCEVHNYGIVGDEEQLVADFFNYSLHNNFDLVLTTGGTGGGDFDLVESGFVGAGGAVICNSLDMRPGKSTVIGHKGQTLYVGLPGPPPAAHTVFLEIVVPLLMQMKGVKSRPDFISSVVAAEEIRVKTRGNLLIKEGVVCLLEGVLLVRMAGKKEYPNCNILIPPGKDYIGRGENIEVNMRESIRFLP